jgi:endonuclease III
MKNATKHADNVRSLVKKLLKEGKPDPKQVVDPVRALVSGILTFDTTDNRCTDAWKVIDREFVDINELRVATELEVIDLIGSKYPQIEQRAVMFRESLNAIFEKEHTLSLERLRSLGRKEARQVLRELPEVTPYVEAYTTLHGLDEAAIPVDKTMLDFLIENDCLEPETSIEDAQKFLEGQFKVDEQYDAYFVIRRAALKRGK